MLSACGKYSGTPVESAKIEASADWDRASNLTEAIYDIHPSTHDRSGNGFVVSYYNLDHTSTDDLFKEVHLYHTGGSIIRSDVAGFSGKMDCDAHCANGTLTLKYDSPISRLNGSVRIQFFQTALQSFSKKTAPIPTSDTVEAQVARSIETHYLMGGTVSQYRMNGGWVTPFELNLDYATSYSSQVPNESITFHGTKLTGSSVKVSLENPTIDQDTRLPATISLIGKDSVEVCFGSQHALVGVGAYGPLHQSTSTELCGITPKQ
jgi:hypothetical protein